MCRGFPQPSSTAQPSLCLLLRPSSPRWAWPTPPISTTNSISPVTDSMRTAQVRPGPRKKPLTDVSFQANDKADLEVIRKKFPCEDCRRFDSVIHNDTAVFYEYMCFNIDRMCLQRLWHTLGVEREPIQFPMYTKCCMCVWNRACVWFFCLCCMHSSNPLLKLGRGSI